MGHSACVHLFVCLKMHSSVYIWWMEPCPEPFGLDLLPGQQVFWYLIKISRDGIWHQDVSELSRSEKISSFYIPLFFSTCLVALDKTHSFGWILWCHKGCRCLSSARCWIRPVRASLLCLAGLLVPIQTWVHSKKASVWQGSGKYGNNMGPLILFPHISYNMLLEHVPVF